MKKQSTLGDVLFGIEAGKSFQTSEVLARDDELGVLKVSAISWTEFKPEEAKAVIGYEPEAHHRVRSGDLLTSRANTKELVGAVVLVEEDHPFRLLSDKTLRLVVDTDRAAKPYLLYALRSAAARKHIEHFATGTSESMRNIAQGVITSIPITLPCIQEQRHIAEYLKIQLAAVEEARQAAQAQLTDAKRLIPAILSATFDNLTDAEWTPIGDVAKTTSGTTPSRGQKNLWEPPLHPWVKTGEVAFKTIHQTEESVSAKALAECSLTLLPVGTVLVAMYGQGKTRGQSALLNVAATTNQACFAILPSAALDPEYLQFWLRHSYEALRSLSDSRGGNQSNLNGALMNAFEVPLLPLEQQKSIASHIKQAIADANALQQTVEQQLRDIELLPSRLLSAVFGPVSSAQDDAELVSDDL